MTDHKFVRNRKTGVVFGRNPSLDKHPDCEPYFPPAPVAGEAPAPVPEPEPVPATVAAIVRTTRKKASASTGAATAAAAAAEDAVLSAALALDPESLTSSPSEE